MVQNTSLFGLTTDTTVDAGNMCNEMRFLNHSSQPNVRPVRIGVNGDTRIAFVAQKDIPPQTEMTFYYGPDFAADEEPPTSSSRKRTAQTEKQAPSKRAKLKGLA